MSQSPDELQARVRVLEEENRRFRMRENVVRQSSEVGGGQMVGAMSDLLTRIVDAARAQKQQSDQRIKALMAVVSSYEAKMGLVNQKLGEVVTMHNTLLEEYEGLKTYVQTVGPSHSLQPPSFPRLALQSQPVQSLHPSAHASSPDRTVVDAFTHESVSIEIQECAPIAAEEGHSQDQLVLSAVEHGSSADSSEYTDSTLSP